MGGEVIGINTETFDENEAAIKEAKKSLKARAPLIAIFPLTLIQPPVNMLLILWHFQQQF